MNRKTMRELLTFLAVLLCAAAILALSSCSILPTGEPVSLVAVGLEVGESGVWTDGTSVVAKGDEARTRIWSKAPTLWTVPVEWVEVIDRDLSAGETVCIRFHPLHPQELVVLGEDDAPPVWARWAPPFQIEP